MTARPPPAQAGFTLVELLTALALTAMLSALIFAGLHFGSAAWRHADRHRAGATDIAAVLGVLKGAIGRAYPAFASDMAADQSIAFTGDVTSLSLVAPLPAAIEEGVLARQRFFVAVAENGRRSLVMAWRLDLPASAGDAPLPERQAVLIEDVRRIAFGYYGAPSPGQEAAWLDRWPVQDRLPALVRVAIEAGGSAASAWPVLAIELHATTNAACRYDPVDFQCRRTQ